MDNALPSIIKNDLRKSFKKAKDEQKAKTDSELPKQSEQVMAEAEKFAKKRTPLPSSKKEQARKKVEEEAEKPKAEVEKKLLEEAQAKRYVILFEPLEGAPLFRPEWFGPQNRIWENTRHRSFSDVYQATGSNPKARTTLGLMLCVLADSELHAPEKAEVTLRDERVEWSGQLDLALRLYEWGFGKELEAAEAATA